jgi:hypothetical protein
MDEPDTAAADGGLLRVGDAVQLTDDASPVTTTMTPACLERGESGVIVACDDSSVPYRVRGPRGDTQW